MQGYEYIIIVSIVSMLIGLNARIIWDWLSSKKVNGNYVSKELCEARQDAITNVIKVELRNIHAILDDMKREIREINLRRE